METLIREGGVDFMSKVRDIMSTDIVSVSPKDNIFQVATLMRDHDVGLLPVVENDRLIGVISDRDIVIRCIAEKRPNSCSIKEVMSDHLVVGNPEMSIDEVAELMADEQVRRLPIVENNRLVGMVSIKDLAVRDPFIDEMSGAMREISETDHRHVSNRYQH
jgi:CBS domain-containing protein